MADALCGPSNALQNFQKHTAVDRTLQQDRIVNRHPSAQGFRSQHHNAAVLDPEFEAFENNLAGNAVPQLRPGGPAFGAPIHSQPVPAFAATDGGHWASDFQKLQVSGPSTNIQQGHIMSNQAFRPATINGWQNEFMQHQQHQPQQNSQPQFRQGPMTSFQPSFMPNYQGMNGMVAPAPPDQGSLQTTSTVPAVFDESAFEAAFNQAQADMHEHEMAVSEQHQVLGEDIQSKEVELTVEAESTEQIRIGSDLIGVTDETPAQGRKEDPDELAKTAGHLLDSVSHDTSQKFKESSFLALMRRIRDREVQIEGDEFREVSSLP
ncbi:conserved hypothetical protein [Talaromyces stipitatus ATCC 10500]|uniref:Peroxin 20 n=1 Tax=Talaromyces stipitatus (strain ATCC 10500 / CBS 375.48 / QM 6759 / NRRL 1006) TaxID=441959 RepID=B8LTR9_TALSN|nr:uncharacterized protein TSTA_070690 [Talaromyces stipitatus ATCC 10500]XP_002341049.1 uncharacterized protein TSTA_070690 [Talaromyces stipitatus ATCC 10500]EED23661.1 conserved hypothetical protein [Talaromyces stipitatus ATCC 10500]EED23662.1 conserved hypothetical protein [Talaromyces stipitatus ATCC 10500]